MIELVQIWHEGLSDEMRVIADKLNELIEAVNKMERDDDR